MICLKVRRLSLISSPGDGFGPCDGESGAGTSRPFEESTTRVRPCSHQTTGRILTVCFHQSVLSNFHAKGLIEQLMRSRSLEQPDERLGDSLPTSGAELLGVVFQELLEA